MLVSMMVSHQSIWRNQSSGLARFQCPDRFSVSIWHNLKSSEKREPQLKNCLDQMSLWSSWWEIVLINHWCGGAWATLGGTIPRQSLGLCCIRQLAEWAREPTNKQESSMVPALGSCLDPKPQWWMVTWTVSQTNPVLPKLLWSEYVISATGRNPKCKVIEIKLELALGRDLCTWQSCLAWPDTLNSKGLLST